MIGIVIVTHGNLAREFKLALEHVVGSQEQLVDINIHAEDDMEVKSKEIADAVAKVNNGKGVIILTDLFGGTPSNVAISMMQDKDIEVIAGINLPMLVKLSSLRAEEDLHLVAEKTQEAGKKYIHVASKVLSGN